VALSAVTDIDGHRAAARAEGRWPVLYKLDPRRAALARQAGLQVLTVAREAWLDPMAFRLDLPTRAGLRRKLRRAEAAGVTATKEDIPDWAELGRVNRAWVAARGREHGFAMGRFDPAYLATQTVIVARQGDAVAGFASFHVARIADRQVWTLDLLRPDPAAPEGTAQRMIVAALGMARQSGAQAFSLAAVPIGACMAERGLIARLGRAVTGDASQGLEQFKAGFAPRWQRLYIAAPSILALAITGVEIRRQICRPAALAGTGRPERREVEYEIAYGCNPWQREGETQA
jgi:phosphatidylglycerol lysyltransferase